MAVLFIHDPSYNFSGDNTDNLPDLKMQIGSKMTRSLGRFKHIPKLNLLDKIILAIFIALFFFGLIGSILTNHYYRAIKPAPGGALTEGIVAKSVAEANTSMQNLTGMGLVRFDGQGNIVPGLAKSYTISPDSKIYTFTLQKGLDATKIALELHSNTDKAISNFISVKNNQIIIKLDKPFSPVLADLTAPTLDPGPYKITKRTKTDILLSVNNDFPLAKPYISTIDIKIYSDQKTLDKALNDGSVMSGIGVNVHNAQLNKEVLTLSRNDMLLLNLTRDPWKDVNSRRKLVNYQKFDQPINLTVTLPASPHLKKQFDNLKKKYKPLNVNLKSNIVPMTKFNNDVIAKKDFDSLLITIDNGRDLDPYPFWHSSQIEKGQNLASFNNLGADKLMEKIRETTNLSDRQKLYYEFQGILKDQAPVLNLGPTKINYYVSKKVKGVKIDKGPTISDRFDNVWQWNLKTKKVSK